MQYSPKLKKAMEEIKAIVKRHDIAAHVVLHTPGHSEFWFDISPSYSCAKVEGDNIRFKAKTADFDGIVELRNQRIKDTANMLNLITTTGGTNLLSLAEVSKNFDKLVGASYTDEGFTSHSAQNN